MKKVLLTALLMGLISMPCQAKTFYGNMKDNLSTRADLQKHYNFNRKIGAVIRYAPSEYQVVGLVGVTTIDFIGKEVLWDACLSKIIFMKDKSRQGHFDMEDAAANFKGVKDGMNGRNELEENEFKKTIQTVNYLTENFIKDNTARISQQENIIKELKARIELLEKK